MIGVVVPAHNEEALLGACLQSITRAACDPQLHGESVRIVVVLDACTDGSADIAAFNGAICLMTDVRNVGMARRVGADYLLARGARWLSFTDADTTVSPNWLSEQLSLSTPAVCGTVAVADWDIHPPQLRSCYELHYQDREGHRHIHGANLGISADAYRQVGGFPALACSEDVALVQALIASGIDIAWSAAPRVHTSARTEARINGGFASFLMRLAETE